MDIAQVYLLYLRHSPAGIAGVTANKTASKLAKGVWRGKLAQAIASTSTLDDIATPQTYQEVFEEMSMLRSMMGRDQVGSLVSQGIPANKASKIEGSMAKLVVGGKQFWDMEGGDVNVLMAQASGVSNVTARHAEGNVFGQAVDAGVSGDVAILFVDRPMCNFCSMLPNLNTGYRGSGGVIGLARKLGVRAIKIVHANPAGYSPSTGTPVTETIISLN